MLKKMGRKGVKMPDKTGSIFRLCAIASLGLVSLACAATLEVTPIVIIVSPTPNLQATIEAGVGGTQTALAPTADLPATVAAGIAQTLTALPLQDVTPTRTQTPPPATPTPDMSNLNGDKNVAVGKPVIKRAGGVNHDPWGHANDAADYNSTTKPGGGRWGIETNNGGGTFQVIDLGQEYLITGVGYSLDWDAAFKNPLKYVVQVSNDLENWISVSEMTHQYDGVTGSSIVNVKLPVEPIRARYVKFWEPPDGAWNGWGDFFELRVYAKAE
jgi:hypothetical protein